MMTRLIRWLLAIATGVAAVLVAPSGAAATAPVLDGVQLRYLPAGLGTTTDFAYEYDDVSFVARVWESGSDADGWRVDLDVDVMRGATLSDPAELRDWFIAYEDRPPADARYRAIRVHGHRGWMSRDEIFWLMRPGLAIAVQLDRSRWSAGQLSRTAWGVRAR
jgi:hypothetical protein